MTTYTMTKRFNGEVIAIGMGYMAALNELSNHRGYDVIIHPDSETIAEYQARISREPYDITQGGWAFL